MIQKLAEAIYEKHSISRIDDPSQFRGYHKEAVEMQIGDKRKVFNCR